MLFHEIVMLAATQNGIAAGGSPPPTELFPDPNLEDVADGGEWAFADGPGPTGGTGPGISMNGGGDGATANLAAAGALEVAFLAAISAGSPYIVELTIANFVSAVGVFRVRIGADGAAVDFTPSGNGVVSHTVTAGTLMTPGDIFGMNVVDDPVTFGITHISVEAA